MDDSARHVFQLYERHAAAWDRLRSRTLFERPWLDRFAALLPKAGAVLDLGCGSGEPLTRHLIEAGFRLTGVDAAPAMIATFRRRCPAADWQVADMRTLHLPRTFDGILAWDSFFHLAQDDQRRMFPVFRRLAAPRAALMFTSGPAEGEAVGTFEGEALYHASLAPGEYRSLLQRHDFEVVAHTAEDAALGGHTVWLARSA